MFTFNHIWDGYQLLFFKLPGFLLKECKKFSGWMYSKVGGRGRGIKKVFYNTHFIGYIFCVSLKKRHITILHPSRINFLWGLIQSHSVKMPKTIKYYHLYLNKTKKYTTLSKNKPPPNSQITTMRLHYVKAMVFIHCIILQELYLESSYSKTNKNLRFCSMENFWFFFTNQDEEFILFYFISYGIFLFCMENNNSGFWFFS